MGLVRWGPPTEIIEIFKENYPIKNFIETGTYYGKTALWASERFPRAITIEQSEIIYRQVQTQYSHIKNIEFLKGDTRSQLARIVPNLDSPSLFWLDAHWSGGETYGEVDECPLVEEIKIINRSNDEHFIFIDDARFFTSPPVEPHKIEQWPDLTTVLNLLNASSYERYIVIIDDVIIAVPKKAKQLLAKYCQKENTKAWLEYCQQQQKNQQQKETPQPQSKSVEVSVISGYLDLKKLCQKYSISPRGIIHIGAHEGQELQEYQDMGAKKVLFIEANPSVFQRLKSKITGFSNVLAVNCAVSNNNGTVTLRVNSHDMSSSILPLKRHQEIYPGMREVEQVSVASRKLDSLLQENKLNSSDFNIITIDIQGAELLAFQGAIETLPYIDAICTEVNYEELYEGCALIDQLDDFLGKYGFTRVAIATPSHPSWGDAFYVKKSYLGSQISPVEVKSSSLSNSPNIMVVTSIAPGNIDNQKPAIESWTRLGLKIISLNTIEEIETLKSLYKDVTFSAVSRDGRKEAGRPLVYLDDMFLYLREHGSKICGIINSDIRLKVCADFLELIGKEIENSLILGSRIDVDYPEQNEGEIYAHGFDLFFFEQKVLEKFPSSQFCLGLPWWDLWIPVLAHHQGLNLKYLDVSGAYHVKHKVNYQNDLWRKMGIYWTQFFDLKAADELQKTPDVNPEFLQYKLTEIAQQAVHFIKTNRQTIKGDILKVSAIVSVYNAEKFIQGCLEDLINQTLYQKGQLEIIVIDSNSPQNEGAIVQTFQAKYPHIIYERTAERETLYTAWNRAIAKAKGVYITNANADDRHRPDALEIMANYLDKNSDIVLVYGDQLITNIPNDTWATTKADKHWNWPEFSYSELERRCIIGPQPLWRKSLHEKYGYFRGEFACAGDYEFWLRIGKTEKILRIPEILGLYYYNQQGLEHHSSRSHQETLKIWDEYGLRDRASTAPLVSVIIPCYNHATFLREAVESVVNQTYQNCECIIVNDGSTDDTSALTEYLKNLYPSQTISIINKENTGPADSRNVGIEKSSGLFILFLDADDKIHPNFISECLQVLLEKNTVGFVYTDVQHFGFNCNLVVHGDFDINTFVRDNQAPATSLFRREIYEQVGGLKKVMKLGCEDWEFWISAYEKGWQGYRLPKPYLYYRQHGDGSSRTQKMVRDRVKLDLMRAVIIHLHSALYTPEEIRWGEKILSQNYYLIAEELKQLNNTQESLSVSIEKAWEAYQKEAGNDSAIENLRQARFQLAQKWLNSTLEELANDYGSDLGKLHQKLCQSGLKQEPLTENEQKLINQLMSHLSTGLKQPNTSAYLLAGMLYRRADQLAFNYENAAIPNWLVNDYLKFMFTTPDLFQEVGESNNYYHYIQGWYQYLHQKILSNSETPLWQQVAWFFTQFHNFIPLYFNTENLKKVYSQRGDIIEYALKKRGESIDYIFPARPLERQKIRLGILTKHFGAMTETFATLPAFEYLDRNQFEIILYAINLNGNALEKYCQQRADKLVKLSDDLANQVQTIRGDDLDILLIGTNVAAVTHPITLLAIHRLARIQVTCFNSPVTTGIRNIDYYIAGKLMEPSPESQENYREKLVTIEGVGCCFSYNMEPYSATVKSNRKNIGISEDAIVFISSANFFKLIPELRETWAKILAKVPNSFLVLMPFGQSWTNSYPAVNFVKNMESILQKYGVESNRLRVLKAFPNRADVKEVLKLADVYLDSYPYAGTTSLVDPLEVALPTVVQEGNKLRSRMGAALLRSLSMNDLITNNEESYIQLAVSLATNPQLRQQKREEIAQKMQNNPPFLDSRAYSLSLGNLLKDLFQQWQNSQGVSEKTALNDSQFVLNVNQVMGCVNLYQIDPSVESVVTELRQIRQKFANLWLMTPSEKLEKIYESEIGKAYQTLLNSGIQHEELTQEEQIFVQQLTQLTKGLIHPQAINGLLASMLYFKPGTMRIPNADNRLPHWLISDYKNIFETGIVIGNQDVTEETSTYLLQVQYMTSPLFLNQLLGTINLYRIDSSDQGVVMELRQLRKQLADFWILTPPEKLQSLYQSDLNKAYYALLRSGIVKESMLEAEKTFFTSLITEVSKGMTESNSMNYLLAILLYCRPGQLKVQDANTSLPPWFLSDYETFVQSP
jgi:FkbM family methyltransferase